MRTEFRLSSVKSYFKNNLELIFIFIFLIAFHVVFRSYLFNYAYKNYYIVGVFILLSIILIKGVINYYIYKKTVYIINDHYLQINKGSKINVYNFSNLSSIKMNPKDHVNRTGMNGLELFFDGKKVLKIDNGLPFYEEFKYQLLNSLKKYGYYDKVVIENKSM